jgi:hypothetical protein
VKIFISSVRRGLEEERDAMPAMIRALGHEPLRFEDYTAKSVPSREACLRGVEDADAYLLLLGERYGDPLLDTGKAPTEEEWTVARRRGIPIIAFRKSGVTPELLQAGFIDRVEEYRTGVFRGSFVGVGDLLAAVAGAIREVALAPPPLVWRPLAAPMTVAWEAGEPHRRYGSSTILECHVLPVAPRDTLPATVLTGLPQRLARAGRDHALFAEERALATGVREDEAWVVAEPQRGEGFAGLRVRRDRSVSLWMQLRSDNLGVILDPDDLTTRMAALLRLAADLGLSTSDEVALGVGLQGLSSVNEGRVADLGKRSSASIGFRQADDFARVEPRDAIPLSALAPAAEEIARELATRLMLRFRAVRR